MLNEVHLITLKHVLETGSMSAAGRLLGYTTSAVSQQISALENNLGIQLFERRSGRLSPTAVARRIADTASTMLEQLARLEEEIRETAHRDQALLRISSFPSAGSRLLPSALSNLKQSNREAIYRVSEDIDVKQVIELVSCMQADLGLVALYSIENMSWSDDLVVVPMVHEEVVVLTSENRSRRLAPALALGQLKEMEWVARPKGAPDRKGLEHWCRDAGFIPNVPYEVSNGDTIRGLVRSDLAIALMPALALETDSTIKMHRIEDISCRRTVYLVYRKSDKNPLLAAAGEAISAAAEKFVLWTRAAFSTSKTDSPVAWVAEKG